MLRNVHIFSICFLSFFQFGCSALDQIFELDLKLTDEFIIVDTGSVNKMLVHKPEAGSPEVPTFTWVAGYGVTESNIFVIIRQLKEHNESSDYSCKFVAINHITNTYEYLDLDQWVSSYKEDIFVIVKPLKLLANKPEYIQCFKSILALA